MSRNPSNVQTKRGSLKKNDPKPKDNNDAIFLIQNENEILKLKNIELEDKVTAMKTQLIRCTSELARDEHDCENLRIQIKRTDLTEDIRLESEKRAIEDKIQLLKGNTEIVIRKINEARQAGIMQQSKIPQIKEEKKVLEKTLWENKTENEGTKVLLQNLERELERYRTENSGLVLKRKQYGPKESQISKQIQQRLRVIKTREKQCKNISKKQASELIVLLINSIEFTKKKSSFFRVEMASYEIKMMKKRVFLLSLIRKKYLLFIKNQIMQRFRENFRPLQQIKGCRHLIEKTRLRRTKNRLFRIWKAEFQKRQYMKVRCFQAQTTFEKFAESYLNTVIFSVFNKLKYLNLNPIHRRAAITIQSIGRAAYKRCKTMFFSAYACLQNKILKDAQIQQSAKSHSALMVQSVYFSSWAMVAKQNKVSNRYIKFKYFKELKKLRVLKKKRDLSEMITVSMQKLKDIDITSQSFCSMKKQTTKGLIQSLEQEIQVTNNKNKQMEQKISKYRKESKDNLGMFALLKINRYLKGGVDKAFNLWRKINQRVHKLQIVMNLLHFKLTNDMNFGFAMIQKKRFEKLKKSIADKIQSCQFSYNYLVKENAHIKEVLDTKVLELEKAKFSGILRKLIKAEQNIKHKYFYKFLKSGYKCWKFKRVVMRIDQLIEDKVKRVFVFLLKEMNRQKSEEENLQNKIISMIERRNRNLISLAFGIFENVQIRNRKFRKILQNIFSRNLELNVYSGFNTIKRTYTNYRVVEIEKVNTKVEEKMNEASTHTKKTQDTIQMLRQRLKNKQESLKNRIFLQCRKILIRNSTKKYMHYFNKWRAKLAYQKKIQKFVEIMERKTRIHLKNRLMCNIVKKDGDQQIKQLRQRFENFSRDLNEGTGSYQKYAKQSQAKMEKMKEENQFHEKEGVVLQKRTDRMDDVKVLSFRKHWGKMMCKFAFRQWKNHKKYFVYQWSKVFKLLSWISQRETFQIISGEMKAEIFKKNLRKKISTIYAQKFRFNAGYAFRTWRIVNLNARNAESKAAYDVQVANYKIVSDKYDSLVKDYDNGVNHRMNDRKLRKIFDWLKKYTRLKIDNNNRKLRLQKWLKRGYQIQFYSILAKFCKPEVERKKKADSFFNSLPNRHMTKLFYKLADRIQKKKCIQRLFINKFIHYSLLNVYQSFFSNSKYYEKYVEVERKNDKTMRIQTVLETFDKKRKDILCKTMRKWRKNQYQVNIGKKLFRRLARKAFYNRYEGPFYAWKLQSQAKKVVKYHNEEGEIKKRQVQIKRIEKFIHNFKRDKGLLLENEEGNFVVSPRFQKKKEDQEKKEKSLRYKFISRLIMSINGYLGPVKAYNNLNIYMKLREKYRTSAQFILNHLRRPDMQSAFRIWRKASLRFKQDFQNMERKQLIKVLNRQKDKMQMEYSHKLSVDQQIDKQLYRYKILSHQRDKKEKLCAHVFIRNARKVKSYAFQIWRKRVDQIREYESHQLAEKGNEKLVELQEQIKEFQQVQRQLINNNRKLRQAVQQALEIAEMVKRISEERDKLSKVISEKQLSCESLVQQNQSLNSKLHLAQKQAIRLLVISGQYKL